MEGTSRRRKLDIDEAKSKVFAKYGFICEEGKPVCMICKLTLNNTKEHTMLYHLKTNHPLMKDKSLDVFVQRKKELPTLRERHSKAFFKAEYLIALHIAQNSKPYTIADDFLIPCWTEVLPALNVKLSQYSTKITCPKNIVSLRINELANNICGQIMDNICKSGCWSIQLDYTSIFNRPLVLAFVRHIYDGDVVENLILCQSPSREDALFEIIIRDIYNRNQRCTPNYATDIVTDKSDHIKLPSHINYVISKRASSILSEARKILEDIKRQNSNLQSLGVFCAKTECRFHEISGKPVICANIMIGLCRHRMNSARHRERIWLKRIAYLADLYATFNSMCFSLQINSNNYVDYLIKIPMYLQKLEGIIRSIIIKDYKEFPTLCSLLRFENSTFKEEELDNDMIKAIREIQDIIKRFLTYEVPRWVINPFDSSAWHDNTETPLNTELLQLRQEVELERQFKCKTTSQFWISLKGRFPELFHHAMPFFLRSPTNSFRTLQHSKLIEILNNFKGRFDFPNDLIIRFSSPIKPNIDRLVDELQNK